MTRTPLYLLLILLLCLAACGTATAAQDADFQASTTAFRAKQSGEWNDESDEWDEWDDESNEWDEWDDESNEWDDESNEWDDESGEWDSESDATTVYVPIVTTEPATSQPIQAFGDPHSSHIGHTVLRRPVREAPSNIYTDSGIYYSNEFAPYTKVMEVYGLTFIALPDAPDDFMLQVAKTLKEMFAQTPETDRALQEAVLKEMYRYRAILPIVSEPQSNRLDDVGGAEEVASVADIIMYDVAFQANEVVEHLLHAITSVGMHYALNPEFGLYEQSRLTQAMLEATSLGYYNYPTATFGSEGDSKVLVQEYVYWVIVTGWNIQERYKNGGDEWTIRNAAQLQAQQPSAYNLFENHIPTIMTVPSEATLQWFE